MKLIFKFEKEILTIITKEGTQRKMDPVELVIVVRLHWEYPNRAT